MADAVVDAVWSFLEFTTLLDVVVVAENASLACSVASAAANAMQVDLPLIIAMRFRTYVEDVVQRL